MPSYGRQLEQELLAYYAAELENQVRGFARSVAEAFKSDVVLAAEVRPLIVWRVKTAESLRRKLRERYGNPDEERLLKDPLSTATLNGYIEDLGGVRVIVHDRERLHDALAVVDAKVATGVWSPGRKKLFVWDQDARAVREEAREGKLRVEWTQRGYYRSRHQIVWEGDSPVRCEIQFRSVLEEAIFEAHHRLIYRVEQEGGSPPENVKSVLAAMAEMLSVSDTLVSNCYRWAGANDAPGDGPES